MSEDTGIAEFFEEQDEEVVKVGEEDVVVTAEETPTAEEVIPEVETPTEVPTPEPDPAQQLDLTTDTAAQIETLQQMLREQGEKIESLQSSSTKVAETLTTAGHIEEGELDPSPEEGGSADRTGLLSLLAETMKMNPAYEDFDKVCSEKNFNLTVDALARRAMQEEGGTLTEQTQKVSDHIWGLSNPYKFVYDVVKQNHPDYAKSEPVKDTARPKGSSPDSLSTIHGGSGADKGGWTVAKIDALDEDKLHTVPQEVYEQYMNETLK